MRADRRDPTIAALRKHKPTKFEATLRDGTTKTITLSTKQNRWELLSDTLEALPWVSIQSLDNDGNVLGAIDREGDYEEIDPDVLRGEGIAKIILNAVQVAMSETRKMFADSMKANADMCRSMLESQHVVVESYQLAMKVQAATIGQSAPGEEDNVMKMLQMAMALKMGGSPSIAITPPPKPANPPANGASKKP
jgi:hypothetical protein